MQIIAIFQHETVRGTGVKPDIEDIRYLLVGIRIPVITQEACRWTGKPSVRALIFEYIDDTSVYLRIDQNLARRLFNENCDRHAPSPLTRNHPVRPLFNHAEQPITAARRVERRLVNRL